MIRIKLNDEVALHLDRCTLLYRASTQHRDATLYLKTLEWAGELKDQAQAVYRALTRWSSPDHRVPRPVRNGHMTVQAYLQTREGDDG